MSLPRRVTAPALAIALAGGLLGLASVHQPALAAETKLELAPLTKPKTSVVTTKAGTQVPVWLFPSPKVSDGRPAAGQVVLIAFDAGDGVSLDAGDGVSIAPLVQLLQGMGATVVVFDNPLVGFDNPLVGFDNPLAGFDNPLAGFDNPLVGARKTEAGVAGETHEHDADVLHAMITWSTTHAIPDGKRRRVHLYGVGRGADLALQVGTRRTRDLHRILVDNPTFEVAVGAVDNVLSDPQFRGVHVVRTHSKQVAAMKSGLVSLAPDSMTFPKDATTAQLAATSKYQAAVSVAFPDNEDW